MLRNVMIPALIAITALAGCQASGGKKETVSDVAPPAAAETTPAEPAAADTPAQAPELQTSEQIIPIGKVKSHVNVRERPDAGSAIVGQLMSNETASLVGEAPGWFQVTLNDGTTGFVSRDWTEMAKAEPAATEVAPAEAVAEPAAETPAATASTDPAKMTQGVYFVKPHDGDVLDGPVIYVAMGVKGKKIVPAGELIPGTGHHHLLVDSAAIERGQLIPGGMGIVHFGDAETEVPVSLPKGSHTLTLQFANGLHISYGKDWSTTIHITVR